MLCRFGQGSAAIMQLDTGRFQDADRYIAYSGTTAGKLRLDLAWTYLREFLPVSGTGRRAIDIGCGTGLLALRLAELGFTVDLLDSSGPMLAVATEQAQTRELSHRTSFHHIDATKLPDFFEPSSFHAIVCHNVLEYMDEPFAVLGSLAHLLKNDGESVLSVLVRNRNGEVLKAAFNSDDTALPETILLAETVLDSLYGEPVRVFDPADLRDFVRRSGLQIVAERGVRVVSDYLECRARTEDGYKRLQELELQLGAQQQFAAIARYTQIIARRAEANGRSRA
jgi:S-adenosylmethionine-dependent methyltransferase